MTFVTYGGHRSSDHTTFDLTVCGPTTLGKTFLLNRIKMFDLGV